GVRGSSPALPLSRPPSRRAAAKPRIAPPTRPDRAPAPDVARLLGSGYADADAANARGRARLPGAEPRPPGRVLRASAVAADLRAAAPGLRLRPLFPEREMPARRGPARRPPAGVHADRRRDGVRQ